MANDLSRVGVPQTHALNHDDINVKLDHKNEIRPQINTF